MSKKEEYPYATLWVYKTTRDKILKIKGRGISVDRFINDLMDTVSPESIKSDEDEEKTSRS